MCLGQKNAFEAYERLILQLEPPSRVKRDVACNDDAVAHRQARSAEHATAPGDDARLAESPAVGGKPPFPHCVSVAVGNVPKNLVEDLVHYSVPFPERRRSMSAPAARAALKRPR